MYCVLHRGSFNIIEHPLTACLECRQPLQTEGTEIKSTVLPWMHLEPLARPSQNETDITAVVLQSSDSGKQG